MLFDPREQAGSFTGLNALAALVHNHKEIAT
jgi:hypothetical protein